MRNSRMNTLFSVNKNIPYARKYRKPISKNRSTGEYVELEQEQQNPKLHKVGTSNAGEQPQASTSRSQATSLTEVSSPSSIVTDSNDSSDLNLEVHELAYFTSVQIDNLGSVSPTSERNHENSSRNSSYIQDDISDASTDNIESDNQNEEDLDLNFIGPLHPHLTVTKKEVMIMLMKIFMRHNLSNKALEDILQLINVIIGYAVLP
ncbi:uncharacterized protein LOC134204437, partial [Armigeres subalbatus]|uniref:uncharacterized protein LOC134204437 n=1 Tax=Armigeres subalbatus TaxID=124917 RepID=UPI002ED32378